MTTELPQRRPRRGRLIALAVGLLLLAGAGTAVLLRPSPHRPVAAPPAPPRTSAPPSPATSPTPQLPYPYFAAGSCLDNPQLSTGITTTVARPCDQPHDAESIANPRLPDGITGRDQGLAMWKLCQPYFQAWSAKQGGGKWYSFPVGPDVSFYQQGMRAVSCTMATSDAQGGAKLTGPLKS
ncbi:hypothetical protein ACIGXM_17025 [Kitasatospora sp. NPDC052896]|uniref:hypothetical protein n=1 Tax=Kitasatospora sp. NPDC052896 TaxID=3364061 RepID=UPI0037C82894